MIKPIDQDSIKFIAAGQKIDDIETAIRELVENSIDAGAKNIEIRLTKFGVDCIEVDDNGSGIKEENFSKLGTRYHTSKISDYSKVQESLETFGFRGEALSCLCNVSSLVITTKAQDSPTGTRLTFKKDGSIFKSELIARDNGTTVIVKNLFQSMPVRRRELEVTAKRQYDKVVKLMYELILAFPHIKFSLCKKTSNKKEKDFSHGGTTLEGCLITIFGIKLFDSLVKIKQKGLEEDKGGCNRSNGASKIKDIINEQADVEIDLEKTLPSFVETVEPVVAPVRNDFFKRNCSSKFAREKPEYTIYGYISKIGQGRNSSDCQFLFVNKKPCDLPKVSRVINEIYRNYSGTQYPFFCIFIEVQAWAADFNVPRKRAIILQEESKLCNLIQDSIKDMFSSSVPASQKFCPAAIIPKQSSSPCNITVTTRQAYKRPIWEVDASDEININDSNKRPIIVSDSNDSSKPIGLSWSAKCRNNSSTESSFDSNFNKHGTNKPSTSVQPESTETVPEIYQSKATNYIDTSKGTSTNNDVNNPQGFKTALQYLHETSHHAATKNNSPNLREDINVDEVKDVNNYVDCHFEQRMTIEGGRMKIQISHLEDLSKAIQRERSQRKVTHDTKEFSFEIDPKFNVVAEEELKLHLNKSSFKAMRIIGQFNNGFIITRLNKHLFIIDQHATDERANYEDQLEKSPLIKQTMVHPKPLYLNLIQENAIINNLLDFQKRGFDFKIDTTKLPGYRVLLTSTSICKGQGLDEHLTKEDVEELIDIALESPNQLKSYVLKKVRSIAATRACRKSVMIGDKLSWQQMFKIVTKMADLNNPWVCAHNRPTIRHLMDVDWMRD